jgi:periplasmic protein TonB
MQEAVSAVLIGRSREADGLSRMVLLSLGVHLAFLTVLALVPPGWLTSEPEEKPKVTTISLGGVAGQDTGGMTPIATRTVQAEAAPNTRPVVAPPAANTPAMVAPTPDAKPKPAPKPVEKPVDKAATRKPSTGAEVKTGPARVDTPNAAEVPFGGLSSSSGGGTGGARIEGDFCCPAYIETMKSLIYANWNQQQGARGSVDIKFIIRRDGVLTAVSVDKSSGNPLLDLESRKAVLFTKQLPPLPDQFTRPTLTVYLTFEYKR